MTVSSNDENSEMIVTPWEVKGKVDYERLIREFGTQPLTKELLNRIESHTGSLHLQLQRHIFFSHRDLDAVIDLYEKGTKFVIDKDVYNQAKPINVDFVDTPQGSGFKIDSNLAPAAGGACGSSCSC